MRVGVYLGGHIFGSDVRQFVELARVAEEVGLDDVAMGEHLVMGSSNPMPPWGGLPTAFGFGAGGRLATSLRQNGHQ